MSMIGNYLALSVEQLEELIAAPSRAEDLAYPDAADASPDGMDIDKSWHLIHFLLNGETWGGEGPLFNLVLGGVELPDTDAGYGPFRYLDPAAVQASSAALTGISSEQLWSRFDAGRVEAAEIYPVGWSGDEGDKEYIRSNFEALRKFFSEAAASGRAMLLYLS